MPLTGVNINNVSMDYFLRGVDAAKPQGVQGGRRQDGLAAGRPFDEGRHGFDEGT